MVWVTLFSCINKLLSLRTKTAYINVTFNFKSPKEETLRVVMVVYLANSEIEKK